MNAKHRVNTVVIGTSLTPVSDDIVRAGVGIARAAGAQAVLVHAFQAPPAYATAGGTPYVPDLLLDDLVRAEQERAHGRLSEQIDRLGFAAEELASCRVEYGPAHRVITEVADAVGADLVVVGSTESKGIARMLGSTADRVVRKAMRPVLVVHDRLELPLQRILLPVDLSPLSAEAFRRGLDLLDQLPAGQDVELEALYVETDEERSGLLRLADLDFETAAARELRRFVADNTFRSGRRVATRVTYGDVEEAIRTHCVDWESDLIVLGTHGRGGFERFLLGSVAADLVRHGATSVLVIPPLVTAEEAVAFPAQEANVYASA
jgi:nucleotide-binding universal stress UspA family protein